MPYTFLVNDPMRIPGRMDACSTGKVRQVKAASVEYVCKRGHRHEVATATVARPKQKRVRRQVVAV